MSILDSKRPYSFFFHYNKPASRQRGHPVMTLHVRGACHTCRALVIDVPTTTREQKTQPHIVVTGKATRVVKEGDTITIQ